MINSENVLNTAQLEEIVQTFVHEFCKEKRDIHSQNVTWYTDEDQKEKIRQIGFSKDGRPVAEVVEEMMKEVYHYTRRWKSSALFRICSGTCFFDFLAWRYYDFCIQYPCRRK